MIQSYTKLNVADNAGAKRVQCIKVLGGSRKRYGRVGDIIVVTIKTAVPGGSVKKGEVSKAVLVRTKKEIGRSISSLPEVLSAAAAAPSIWN